MTCKGWRHKYDVEEESRSPEVNGNSCLGKRKRSRSKKHCGYLQEWLDKSWAFQQQPQGPYGFEEEPVHHRVPGVRSGSYWPNPNPPTVPILDRRLYPTVSEPAMCRYSIPVGYSLEPVSLPVYASYVPVPEPIPSRRRGHRPSAPPPAHSSWHGRKESQRISKQQTSADGATNDEFTSLPPATNSHAPDAIRRRFSDPGIGRPPEDLDGDAPCCTADSSDSEDTCSHATTPEIAGANNALVLSLVEQVNALQDSNKQLYQELRETKAELETLKQSYRQMPPEYEPGMLSDLIREIRDAARVREEVLLNRVYSMLENSGKGRIANHVLELPEKNSVMSQKLENIEDQLNQLHIKKEKTKDVTAQAHGISDNQAEQLCALEIENLQLRRGLQEAIAKSKDKEAHAQQLEKMVDVLRRKINVSSVDEKPASSEQSPSESLVSTVSSSSTTHSHSPQVTLSGPVTDL